MMGGEVITETTRRHALEMLERSLNATADLNGRLQG
jgi:hypothetical protein